jgi:outer membrane protein assembly factor BamA
MHPRIFLFIFMLCLGWHCCSWAANGEDRVYIDSISVVGNEKTKAAIILREMSLREGDTLQVKHLSDAIEQSEQMILNTGLFNRASISFKAWEGATGRVHLLVTVEETWFVYPIPIFELADRNFNVWWVEQNRSLKRTNYGMDFAHINVSGRNDRLKASLKYGYTRRYSLSYSLPYINKARTLGLSTDVSFLRNREVNYQTIENKQAFFIREDAFMLDRFQAKMGAIYRPGIQTYHRFDLRYHQNRVGDEVAQDLNPRFFLNGRHLQRFFALSYRFFYENRDVAPYPWEGSFLEAELEKQGIGVWGERDGMTLSAAYGHYFPFGERWSLGMQARGKYSLIRSPQPYRENRGIGFGKNNLRGFEYYIIDGLDMGMLKSSLKFRFWDNRIHFGKLMPIDAFRTMPFRLHLTFNSDFGYVNSPHSSVELNNFLDNRLLWGGGIGLDIVLFYDKVIQIEYSVNDLLENGLFLHLSMNI